MAAVDLSDAQIEKLLSEAETRLANQNEPVSQKPKAVPATTVQTSEKDSSKPVGGQETLSRELSVRIPELPKSRKKKDTPDHAGEEWFNMPRTRTDPQAMRDLQILKLRNVLALGKQHFKKDGRKDPVPRFSQFGTLVEGPTDFFSGRLTRKERKRTLVEEVLASNAALSKFKTKYDDIQERSRSGKRAHYKKLMAKRRRGG